MGLAREMVQALAREHVYKPIRDTALLIGRQTVYITPQQLLTIYRENGVDVSGIDPRSIALDQSTIDRNRAYTNANLVKDTELFRLLGVREVLALDHSAYEQADIIHDLRFPLPPELHGKADFLIDGSTLDNVFTPSVTIENYGRLLRPGGRLLAVNAFSGHDTPYAIMPPLWFVDYFVMNRFADCKVYVLLFSDDWLNVFYVDLNELSVAGREMGRFRSPHHMVTLVFAEKGEDSTSDRLPIQQDYRSAEDWRVYRENLSRMLPSKRPHVARSTSEPFFREVTRGHLYVDKEFVVRRE